MSRRVEVLQVNLLQDAERELLFEHLASCAAFQPSHAQFGYDGRTVAVELELPRVLLQRLSLSREAPLGSAQQKSDQAQAQQGPSSASFGGTSGTLRSCQWLHKNIDDVFQFRAMQFRFDTRAANEILPGRRSQTPPSSTRARRMQGSTSSSNQVRKDSPTRVPQAAPGGSGTLATFDDLSVAVYQMLSKKFGVPSMVKKHASELLNAVKAYRHVDLDVQLFGVLLSSQAYDTWDVQQLIEWRTILIPYTLTIQETVDPQAATSSPSSAIPQDPCHLTVSRRFIKAREIPALLRRCLLDKSERNAPTPVGVGPDGDVLWQRVRAALPSWCDAYCRFPGLVPDANFYCPPFRQSNPYVGQAPLSSDAILEARNLSRNELVAYRQHLLSFEGAFSGRFEPHQVVHLSQVLVLLLLCWKEERLHPSPWFKAVAAVGHRQSWLTPRKNAASPGRTASGSGEQPIHDSPRQSPLASHSLDKDAQVLAGAANNDNAVGMRARTSREKETIKPPHTIVMMDLSPMQGSPPREAPLLGVASQKEFSCNEAQDKNGESPTLRDEDERFRKDLLTLEQRLASAIRKSRNAR